MKKMKLLKKVIIGLLIVFAAMSFVPCVIETIRWMPMVDDLAGYEEKYWNYVPLFSCSICIIEIILILFTKDKCFLIIGICLDLFKTFVPWKMYQSGVTIIMGGLTQSEFSLAWTGYIIIGIGIITSIVYFLEILSKEKTINL